MADETNETTFPYELSNGVVLREGDTFVTNDDRTTYTVKNVFRDVSGLDKETLKFPQQDGEQRTYVGCETFDNTLDPREVPARQLRGRAKLTEEKFVAMLNDGEIERED